jgi:6-hydroxynicotinate 3-monooxygenase
MTQGSEREELLLGVPGGNVEHQPRIAIVGAGPGGTIAAICLQRFGYEVTVFEAVPKLERLGAGISLSPNITRVFRELGLFDRMAAVGTVPRQRLGRDAVTGEITFALPVDEMDTRFGAPNLIMHRGDLQEILTGALAPGTIRLGKRLVDVVETTTAARLLFADGMTAETDIVIGADGINSRIRELLLGPERPIYSGEIAHRSIYPIERLGGLHVADHTKWAGDDFLHILIYFITHAHDVMYFVTGVSEPDWGSEDYAPRPADMTALREQFAAFHPDVRSVLAAAPAATAWPILEREPLPLWSRGRIVLLGDACHPMRPNLGQGAAMAMEDGVMLARCIAHVPGGDAAAIFALYEAQRRERTSRVQARSQAGDWLRHGMGDAEWVYGYDVWRVPLELPLGSSGIATAS